MTDIMKIDYTLIDSGVSKVESSLNAVNAGQYQALSNTISSSKGAFASALKEELAQEGLMVQEISDLLKEIGKLVKEASASVKLLDHTFCIKSKINE